MKASQYIARETRVSVIINSVMSLIFFLAIFGGQDPVRLWGVGEWVFDFIPQSFMIAALSTLVPGALTARKLKAGAVEPSDAPSILPRNLILRALVLALASVVAGTALVAGLVAASGLDHLPHLAALLLKVGYGAMLAIIVTPPGLRAALAVR